MWVTGNQAPFSVFPCRESVPRSLALRSAHGLMRGRKLKQHGGCDRPCRLRLLHPLELFADMAWDTYCPVARVAENIGETVATCGLVIAQRTQHQITGEPIKLLTLTDWTGMVETELFAQAYKELRAGDRSVSSIGSHRDGRTV